MLALVVLMLSSGDIRANGFVPVPTKTGIVNDLIGRKLSEGMEDGYFKPDWKWTIEDGEIRDFVIVSQDVTEDNCSFILRLTLKKAQCPTRYCATVKVNYSLENNKWRLVMVKSLGVKVVPTERYLDCITPKMKGEYIKYLTIRNKIDSPLLVGGEYLSDDTYEWHKFSTTIGGLQESCLSPMNIVDYRIHFVELY